MEMKILHKERSSGDLHLTVCLGPEQSSELCMNGKKFPRPGKEGQRTSWQDSPWCSHELVTRLCSNQPERKTSSIMWQAPHGMFRIFLFYLMYKISTRVKAALDLP